MRRGRGGEGHHRDHGLSLSRSPTLPLSRSPALPRGEGPRIVRLLALVVVAASAIALSSCSSPALPRRLYVLTPLTQTAPVSRVPGAREATIGVGPVELPQYVNRPEIVTGHDSPVLQSAAVAEWAEPLRDGFTRVLAENLSLLLATERVAIFPWQGGTPEYQVVVNVIQFLGQPGGDVALVALWSLLGRQGQEVLVSKKASFREPTSGQDYEALAAAMSRTVAALSRDIAAAVSALPPRASAGATASAQGRKALH